MTEPDRRTQSCKSRQKAVIERRQSRITARLSEQGAMLEELRTILPMLQPRSARDDARRVIIHENVLRRPSVTSRRKIFEKLSGRYFRSDAPRAVSRFVQVMQTVQDPLQSGMRERLSGKRFVTPEEFDVVWKALGDQIVAKLKDGFEVVVDRPHDACLSRRYEVQEHA